MVILLTQIDKTTVMQGKSDDFKSSGWFNNPDIAFAPTNNNGKVTLTAKPKNNFRGELYSTIKSNRTNPNGLSETFGVIMDWSPNGKILAVADPNYETSTTVDIESGRVYLYKFEELSKPNPSPFNILELKTDENDAFLGISIRWNPDGTKLAVGISGTNSTKGAVFIYNVTDINDKPNPSPSAKILPTNVSDEAEFGIFVNWNFDGTQLAIGAISDQNRIGSVHVYNTIDLTSPVNIIIPPGRTSFSDTSFGSSIEWNSTNTYLAISAIRYDKSLPSSNNQRKDDSGAIYIYSVEKLKTTSNPAPEHVLESPTGSGLTGWNLRWSPNSIYLAVSFILPLVDNNNIIGIDNQVAIYKTNDFKSQSPNPVILSSFTSANQGIILLIGLDWNKTSTKLAVGSSDYIYMFDINKIETGSTPTQKITLPKTQLPSTFVTLRWHPLDKYLAVGLCNIINPAVVYILH